MLLAKSIYAVHFADILCIGFFCCIDYSACLCLFCVLLSVLSRVLLCRALFVLSINSLITLLSCVLLFNLSNFVYKFGIFANLSVDKIHKVADISGTDFSLVIGFNEFLHFVCIVVCSIVFVGCKSLPNE